MITKIRFCLQITTVYHRLTTQVRQNKVEQNNDKKVGFCLQITTDHHGLTTQVRQQIRAK